MTEEYCTDCKCKDIGCGTDKCEDLHKYNYNKIKFAGDVIRDTELCDLPKVISKGFEGIWCVFKNIINNICCLSTRMDCVEIKEQRECETIKNCLDPRINKIAYMANAVASGRSAMNEALKALLSSWEAEVKAINEYNAQERARYASELAQYEADLATAEKMTKQEGYASEVCSQSFIMENVTGGIISVTTTGSQVAMDSFRSQLTEATSYPSDELARAITGDGSSDYLFFVLTQGQSITVMYNTIGARLGNDNITKAKVTYTAKTSGANGKTFVVLFNSITDTLNWCANDTTQKGHQRLNVKVELYNEVGNHVSVKDQYIAFNSLNAGDNLDYEGVENFKGRFIYINGSSVKDHDGIAYSDTNNNYTVVGFEWDSKKSSKFYYGGIIGKMSQDDIEYDLVLNKHMWAWFQMDTKLASVVTPVEPVPLRLKQVPEKPNGELYDTTTFTDTSCVDLLDDCDFCITKNKDIR